MTLADLRGRLFRFVDAMTRSQKRAMLLAIDVILAPLSLTVACVLLSNELVPIFLLQKSLVLLVVLPILAGLMSAALGIPWIKLKAYELLAIVKTAALAMVLAVVTFATSWAFALPLPLIGVTLFGLFFFLASVGARVLMLRLLLWILRSRQHRTRVLIYGAGTTGMQLAAALKNHESIAAVAFVDDSTTLQSMTVAGMRVFRPSESARSPASATSTGCCSPCRPRASPNRRASPAACRSWGSTSSRVPSFAQLVGTEALIDNLAPVVPGKFLGRKQVDTLGTEGCDAYHGKVILVSGAGGSIGAEICRQLLALRPEKTRPAGSLRTRPLRDRPRASRTAPILARSNSCRSSAR